eukprot:TRINITY_DN52512_c0_g1_i1.p1 TRINITY_DN52512_c0_g1~~TRINITY_DN52512_c0_g1_i1.p1  ORF type:complete len:259 (+),score=45.70 TRINITY_DN52512_c0_g1_i1:32-778(+)
MAPKGWIKDPTTNSYVPAAMVWPSGIKPGSAQHRYDKPEPPAAKAKAPHWPQTEPPHVLLVAQAPPPPLAKGKAKAQGASASGSQGGGRKKSWWSRLGGCFGKLSRLASKVSTWLIFLLIMVLMRGQEGPVPHVSRSIGSIADVSVARGHVASLLLNQTGDLAATTRSAVQTISASTLSGAQAAWAGIDLHNMTGFHRTGKVIVDDAAILEHWILVDEGAHASGCQDLRFRTLWAQTAKQVSVELPFL